MTRAERSDPELFLDDAVQPAVGANAINTAQAITAIAPGCFLLIMSFLFNTVLFLRFTHNPVIFNLVNDL